MTIINNQEELNKYYIMENNSYTIADDVEFKFNINVESQIFTLNLICKNIKALKITTASIKAQNISAGEIDAIDINACYINANKIYAGNITAYNIKAAHIKAYKINSDNLMIDYDFNRGKIIFKQKIAGKRKAAGHGAKVLKK
ncbi:MAG TPA: hypothetical protein PKY25_02795 [Bacilli bacterium]|nr:hypothetical protein [Bacilli bacterium]